MGDAPAFYVSGNYASTGPHSVTANHLLFLCALMVASSTASAASCRAGFGDITDMRKCETVALPRFIVQFIGTSQPTPGIPMLCWNYRITAKETAASTEVSQCHTGELGGEREFQLDGKPYTFLFDLSKGCQRSEQGYWAPQQRGHAFLPGARDSRAVRTLRDREQKAEAACYGRGQARK